MKSVEHPIRFRHRGWWRHLAPATLVAVALGAGVAEAATRLVVATHARPDDPFSVRAELPCRPAVLSDGQRFTYSDRFSNWTVVQLLETTCSTGDDVRDGGSYRATAIGRSSGGLTSYIEIEFTDSGVDDEELFHLGLPGYTGDEFAFWTPGAGTLAYMQPDEVRFVE